ncbi:MAG: 50S ribosomal protein L3 [Planctomycetaceae bacterium]|nr:50S ribosomal protein L3 [Planctomycetaceae bacterium]
MPVGLVGTKVGMTRVFDEEGNTVPVTVVKVDSCRVLQVKTVESDGYEAVQLGFGEKPRRLAARSERGHVAALSSKRQKARQQAGVDVVPKAECEPARVVKEFRTDGEEHGLEVGQEVGVSVFADVAFVDVVGVSKGRGTAGVMKRHNFSGQRATHGVNKVHRHGGSIGMSADPSRVLKGTRMAGQYGNAKATVRHLKLVKVDEENNLLLVKGGVPGPNGADVVVRQTNKT